ncbi:MAG: M23 family metallopeptidase [Alphaproteobacteria bacterium]|nr:M23 family metallopeptidase [Alphaproteobacteria bacterium]
MKHRGKFLYLTIFFLASLGVTGCAQPEKKARYYQYGGVLSAGSSLGFHTLRKGETLWAVARRYDVDLRDMLDLNGLRAPYKMGVGDRIKIPAPQKYTVKNLDTLYKVSRMFDTTTTELTRLNNINPPYRLLAGQTLHLPPRHRQLISVEPVSVAQSSANLRIEREDLKPLSQSHPAQSHAEKRLQVVPVQAVPVQGLTGSVNFIKPVSGQIISGYGPKEDGLHNDGINIRASQGTPVRAAEQGVVVYQGNQIEGYGHMVLIRHANGYLTAYAHMAKTLVRKGEKIKRGQTIGTVGSSGSVTSPQLHFEIRKGRDAIDPRTLLRV